MDKLELIERFVAGLEKADRDAKGVQRATISTRNAPKRQRTAIQAIQQWNITGYLATLYCPVTREEMTELYRANLALFVAGRHREIAGIKLTGALD